MRNLNNQNGVVGLITIIGFSILLLYTGLGFNVVSKALHQTVTLEENSQKALYTAESGLDIAMTLLDKEKIVIDTGQTYTFTSTVTTQGFCDVSVTNQSFHDGATFYIVTSTGRVKAFNANVYRHCSLEFSVSTETAVIYFLYNGGGDTNDIFTIDPWNTANVPVTWSDGDTNGTIHSNCNMVLDPYSGGGSLNITGNVSATGTVTKNDVTITGSISTGVPRAASIPPYTFSMSPEGIPENPMTFPVPTYSTNQLDYNNTAFWAANGYTQQILPGGSMINSQVLNKKIIYVTGDANFTNSPTITGQGAIIAEGRIIRSWNTRYVLDYLPPDVPNRNVGLLTNDMSGDSWGCGANVDINTEVYSRGGIGFWVDGGLITIRAGGTIRANGAITMGTGTSGGSYDIQGSIYAGTINNSIRPLGNIGVAGGPQKIIIRDLLHLAINRNCSIFSEIQVTNGNFDLSIDGPTVVLANKVVARNVRMWRGTSGGIFQLTNVNINCYGGDFWCGTSGTWNPRVASVTGQIRASNDVNFYWYGDLGPDSSQITADIYAGRDIKFYSDAVRYNIGGRLFATRDINATGFGTSNPKSSKFTNVEMRCGRDINLGTWSYPVVGFSGLVQCAGSCSVNNFSGAMSGAIMCNGRFSVNNDTESGTGTFTGSILAGLDSNPTIAGGIYFKRMTSLTFNVARAEQLQQTLSTASRVSRFEWRDW
ncbi:MAG: hypothetical protein ABID79_00600 [Elusimicrobiota bacterium]